uniref:Uncharacterized protein n=1 Tax=Arundo donax TaxID=35708 RepID=A0A0A9HG33_ARUDO
MIEIVSSLSLVITNAFALRLFRGLKKSVH